MKPNIIVNIFFLAFSTVSAFSVAEESVTELSLQAATNTNGFKLGDSEGNVTNCLGNPRGIISLPPNRKTILFYGEGKVELSQGKVSNIILPDDSWLWSIWIFLNKAEITAGKSSIYKWDLLVNKNPVAEGIWKCGDIKHEENESGGTFFSHPSVPAPPIPYLMRYPKGILILSFTNGLKRAQLTFHDGKAQGPCQFWHPDGSLWMKGQYQDNIRMDNWARWESNGDLSLIDYPKKNQSIQTWGFTQSCVWPSEYIRQGIPKPISIDDEVKWDLQRSDHAEKTSGIWKKGERIPFAEEIYDSAKSIVTIYTIDDKKLIHLSLSNGGLVGNCSWWNLDGSKRVDGCYKDNMPIQLQYYKGNHHTTVEFDESGRAHFK